MEYFKSFNEFEATWDVKHIDDARTLGYIPYFGPCAILTDGRMIQRVIADILRNGRDKYCVIRLPRSMVEIWILPNANQNHPGRPYVYLMPEEGDLI